MYIKGLVTRDGDWWVAEIPAFCIGTQGRDDDEARTMLASAVHDILPDLDFEILWTHRESGEIALKTGDVAAALGFIIKQNRAGTEQSLRDIASAMGANYPNAVAVYEKGASEASISKLDAILGAMGKRLIVTVE